MDLFFVAPFPWTVARCATCCGRWRWFCAGVFPGWGVSLYEAGAPPPTQPSKRGDHAPTPREDATSGNGNHPSSRVQWVGGSRRSTALPGRRKVGSVRWEGKGDEIVFPPGLDPPESVRREGGVASAWWAPGGRGKALEGNPEEAEAILHNRGSPRNHRTNRADGSGRNGRGARGDLETIDTRAILKGSVAPGRFEGKRAKRPENGTWSAEEGPRCEWTNRNQDCGKTSPKLVDHTRSKDASYPLRNRARTLDPNPQASIRPRQRTRTPGVVTRMEPAKSNSRDSDDPRMPDRFHTLPSTSYTPPGDGTVLVDFRNRGVAQVLWVHTANRSRARETTRDVRCQSMRGKPWWNSECGQGTFVEGLFLNLPAERRRFLAQGHASGRSRREQGRVLRDDSVRCLSPAPTRRRDSSTSLHCRTEGEQTSCWSPRDFHGWVTIDLVVSKASVTGLPSRRSSVCKGRNRVQLLRLFFHRTLCVAIPHQPPQPPLEIVLHPYPLCRHRGYRPAPPANAAEEEVPRDRGPN
eukprot:scaffold116_cov334-Pavlova_lutheri.AAC.65